MRNVLYKELKLSASPLSYLFIPFGLMFLIPGYPVLCGAFFVTLGLFQSFQWAREANDIVFSALLPVAKKDVVRGRYLFVCLIEGCAIVLMALCVLLRMTALSEAAPYRENPMMNANPFALGAAFLVFGLFNWIFVGGFFRTAYRFGRPFVTYIVVSFLTISAAEALHHFPGLEKLNASCSEEPFLQSALLASGVLLFLLTTVLSCRKACDNFEKIDL